jgi:alpha-acetolactate decarboxylase
MPKNKRRMTQLLRKRKNFLDESHNVVVIAGNVAFFTVSSVFSCGFHEHFTKDDTVDTTKIANFSEL